MPSLKGTKTEKNLLTAFAGESQARNRYTYFASQAKKDGYEQMKFIFEETASQEKEHAKRLFKFLEGGEVEITAALSLDQCDRETGWLLALHELLEGTLVEPPVGDVGVDRSPRVTDLHVDPRVRTCVG